MEMKKCPICGSEMRNNPRVPNWVCPTCAQRAIDGDGNKVEYYNVSMSGGLYAHHTHPDGQTVDDEKVDCTIDGKKCQGVEFYFGGTGVELLEL